MQRVQNPNLDEFPPALSLSSTFGGHSDEYQEYSTNSNFHYRFQLAVAVTRLSLAAMSQEWCR